VNFTLATSHQPGPHNSPTCLVRTRRAQLETMTKLMCSEVEAELAATSVRGGGKRRRD
jgi:hypothetical protein